MTNPVKSSLGISLSFNTNQNNGSHLICFLWDDIKSNAAPSTTRLKSGGGAEAGVDPAGGQGDCWEWQREQRKEDASQRGQSVEKMSGLGGASCVLLPQGTGLHRSRGWAWRLVDGCGTLPIKQVQTKTPHIEMHWDRGRLICSICPFVIRRLSVRGVNRSSHKQADKRLSKSVCQLLCHCHNTGATFSFF